MSHSSFAFAFALLLTSSLAAGCGGVSYRYGTGSVRTIPGSEGLHAVATEAVDGRAEGVAIVATGDRLIDTTLDRMMTDVRSAVADHVVRAGVVSAERSLLPAPRTVGEVQATLERARAEGAREVVFVRFLRGAPMDGCGSTGGLALYFGILPWLIIDSLPLWRHGAVGTFEVLVASSESGEILGRSARVAAFAEHVSSWGCGGEGVMHDMLRRSLQHALEDVVGQARSGWPNRSSVHVGEVLLSPVTRLEGNRVTSLGWTIDAPAGYALEPYTQATLRSARLTRSDYEHLDVTLMVTNDEEPNFARHAFDVSRDDHSLASEEEVTVSGRPARRGVMTVEGRRVTMLAVAAEGLGFLVTCSGPAELCDPALASFRLTDEIVADGHRND